MLSDVPLFSKLIIFFSLLPIATVYAQDPAQVPLVISVCSHNCAPWALRNLQSIFAQDYTNYRVIYIDDGSVDGTPTLVQEFITQHNLHNKITLIVNPVRVGKLKNIYRAFHACQDQEIIVQIDGDDWLPDTSIFQRINEAYSKHDIWLTYSDFYVYPEGTKEWCVPQPVPDHIKQKRAYRNWKWVFTHLRTFYAWLYKNIKLEDLITELSPGFEGKFFPICNDMAAYFPMLEMCGPRFMFIPEKLYVYNRDNPSLGAKLQGHLYKPIGEDVRKRDKYPLIDEPILNKRESYTTARADLIIFSTNSVDQLARLINSIRNQVTHIATITIVCQAKTPALQSWLTMNKDVQCIELQKKSCLETMQNIIAQSNEQHIVLAKDTIYVANDLNMRACIEELETTQAHAFYFGLSHDALPFFSPELQHDILPHQHIWDTLYAWKFRSGHIHICNNLDMTLFSKSTLREHLAEAIESATLCEFLENWHRIATINHHHVGLFYDTTVLKGDLEIANTPLCSYVSHIPTHVQMKDYIASLLNFFTTQPKGNS